MITVVSLNPCVDYYLQVPNFAVGAHYRTQSSKMIAAGKGTNVCRALRVLNERDGGRRKGIHLCGVGHRVLYMPLLEEEGLAADGLVPIDGTRVNVTIADPVSGRETHLKSPGTAVTAAQLTAFRRRYRHALMASSVVVLVGTLAPGLQEGLYAELVRAAKDASVETVLDASGPAAAQALQEAPTLAKANASEYAEYAGAPLEPTRLADALAFFESKGVRYGVVSAGANGAYLFGGGRVLQAAPPPVASMSSVGAGDVLVALLAMELARSRKLTEDGFRKAVGFASQSVTTPFPGYFDYDEGLALGRRVVLRMPLAEGPSAEGSLGASEQGTQVKSS